MSFEKTSVEQCQPAQWGERAVHLIQARNLLNSALALLDEHSRSPAAANVDLAIHQVTVELNG